MSSSVVIAAANQVVTYELRSLVGETDDFTVVDVADSSTRLEEVVVRRDPDIVLIHDELGPSPVLHTVRDIVARRPTCAVIQIAAQISVEVYNAAMDAGAKGVLAYPASLEDLQARLAAAAQWSRQMRRHLSSDTVDGSPGAGRARLVVVAGAKGGVGTTSVATHLAFGLVRSVAGQSVCLIELDLEKGDLGNLLGITHRLDIADLAKVANDLGPQTVTSAVHRDSSGLAVLLAPRQIEDVGLVADRETRLILAALRRHFDVVIVDAGAHVTPVSAAAIEAADEVILVATPDVLALRGVHRTLDAWGRVGARKSDAVKLLLNRVSRVSDIQPDAVARLVPVKPMATTLPAQFKRLEPGLNHRSPAEVRDRDWWAKVTAVAQEVGLGRREDAVPARRGARLARGRHVAVGDSGQASLEFTAMLPIVALLVVLVWQVALWGGTVALAGHAASEGARAASIGDPVEPAALQAIPGWFRSGFSVREDGSAVVVRASLPLLAPGLTTERLGFTTRVGVVHEP